MLWCNVMKSLNCKESCFSVVRLGKMLLFRMSFSDTIPIGFFHRFCTLLIKEISLRLKKTALHSQQDLLTEQSCRCLFMNEVGCLIKIKLCNLQNWDQANYVLDHLFFFCKIISDFLLYVLLCQMINWQQSSFQVLSEAHWYFCLLIRLQIFVQSMFAVFHSSETYVPWNKMPLKHYFVMSM